MEDVIQPDQAIIAVVAQDTLGLVAKSHVSKRQTMPQTLCNFTTYVVSSFLSSYSPTLDIRILCYLGGEIL